MRLLWAAGAALLALTPALAHEPGEWFPDVLVEDVYDGDSFRATLRCEIPLFCHDTPVRIAGIDTPEIRGKCPAERNAAREAKRRLIELLQEAERVDLQTCSREKFGRLLCRVKVDGVDVGDVLVFEGHARDYGGGKRGGWCE